MSIRPSSVRPLYDHVVRRLESSTKSAGGIVIPDSASEKPNRGEVLAVGPGKLLEKGSLLELSVKPGDHVLFGKYSGTEIRIDGEDVLILKESDILGILENTPDSTLDNTLGNTLDNNAKLEKAA